MKTLIVEDDFTSRVILQEILAHYGSAHVATNGREAVEAFLAAQKCGEPYDLVCLDILMPEMDGQATLREIRRIEDGAGIPLGNGAKIIMTTVLADSKNVMEAFHGDCDAYLIKPINKAKLLEWLRNFNLIA